MKRILLTAWLILPLAVVVLLCVWIARSLQHGAINAPPPRGQGAGATGGANAFGEMLAGRRADGTSREPEAMEPWIIIVEDRSGLSSKASPVYVANSLMKWDPAVPDTAMELGNDGLWRWIVEVPAGGETFEFAFTRGSWDNAEGVPGEPLPARRTLPRDVTPDEVGFRTATFVIESFRDGKPK